MKKNAIQKAIEKAEQESETNTFNDSQTKTDSTQNLSNSESVQNDLLRDLVQNDVEANEGGNTTANASTIPFEKTEDNENANSGQEKESESQQEEKPKIKDGRGRKAMTPEQKAEAKAKRESGQPNGKDLFNQDFAGYKTKEAPKQPNAPTGQQNATTGNVNDVRIEISKFITGALFLIAIDSIIPSFIIKLMGTRNPKYKNVDSKKLKLTAEERKQLEPLADEVVKLIFGTMHPALAFLVCYSIITVGKLLMLDDDDFEPKKKK